MRGLIRKAINPLRFFINDSRATGVILILCTLISLLLSNAGNTSWYPGLWHAELLKITGLHLPETFGEWINDFLMGFFFLLAGMEIKRELVSGELSSFKKAILPFGAAFGGMIVPALIFLLLNFDTVYIHGWGIPTATDIAFSLGVASLFGKRVPVGLKILLMALAIIDDLGAIVVIALFYGSKLSWPFIGLCAILYALLWACNLFKLKLGWIQVLLSIALWYSIMNAGIEASITGVLVAFAMPVTALPKIEKFIHKPVNFFVIPLFALANTAIIIRGSVTESFLTSVSLGVFLGLVFGKPIGIFLFSRLLVSLKIAKLPQNVNWNQLLGMGTLAGIGFTMSIFTTALAFKDVAAQDIAKIAILLSVLASLIISWGYFKIVSPKTIKEPGLQKSTQISFEEALG
jgi:NhaA family Na+:H+ antiporter